MNKELCLLVEDIFEKTDSVINYGKFLSSTLMAKIHVLMFERLRLSKTKRPF